MPNQLSAAYDDLPSGCDAGMTRTCQKWVARAQPLTGEAESTTNLGLRRGQLGSRSTTINMLLQLDKSPQEVLMWNLT